MSTIKDPALYRAFTDMREAAEVPPNKRIMENWDALREININHNNHGWTHDATLRCCLLALVHYGGHGATLLSPEDQRILSAMAVRALQKWKEMNIPNPVATKIVGEIVGSHNNYGCLE